MTQTLCLLARSSVITYGQWFSRSKMILIYKLLLYTVDSIYGHVHVKNDSDLQTVTVYCSMVKSYTA